MSQIYKSAGSAPGVVYSVQGTAPILVNGVSGLPQTGNVVVSLAGTIVEQWVDEGTNFNAIAGTGYFITATCTATLPASPTQGQIFSFIVDVAAPSKLTIKSNTGQFIRVGTDISASGGMSVNNNQGDSLELVYRAADSTFISFTAPSGTWTTT